MDLKLNYGETIYGYWVPNSPTEVDCLFGGNSYERVRGKIPRVLFEDASDLPIQLSTFSAPVLCIENKRGDKILRRVTSKAFEDVLEYVGNIPSMNPYLTSELEDVAAYVRLRETQQKVRNGRTQPIGNWFEKKVSEVEKEYMETLKSLQADFAETYTNFRKIAGTPVIYGGIGGEIDALAEKALFSYPVSPQDAFIAAKHAEIIAHPFKIVYDPIESSGDAAMNELLYYRKRAGG